MENYELIKKVNIISESFEIMGLTLLSECTKKCSENEIQGYAEIAKNYAIKKCEFSIFKKMMSI